VALSHERLLGESADDDMDRVVQGWVLADALDRLRPKHREVLVEIYYEGSSVAEAARRLGIPPGTVKSRAHHALRALRLVLHETETF
jgi:RNA polymerase sigma-70 factor (ECF subfamily)